MDARRFRLPWRPLALACALAVAGDARAQSAASTAAATQRPADFDPKAVLANLRALSAAAKATVAGPKPEVVVNKPAAEPKLSTPKFRVNRLVIEGNTVLPVAELGRLTAGV